jgi:hypothetical protein
MNEQQLFTMTDIARTAIERCGAVGVPLGAAWPDLTGDEVDAAMEAYQAWLEDQIERQREQARELALLRAVVKPAMDEDHLTLGEALKVIEARRRELASW